MKEEFTSIRENIDVTKQNADEIKVEQEYQLSKWVEHDRRINKLERKISN
ncbi:hypothetical protein [Oceanobacillus oncorhynchi]